VSGMIKVAFAEYLTELLECVCSSVAEYGQGPVCWCGIHPGDNVSWEMCGGECGDGVCGMAYVRPMTSFPYQEFPAASLNSQCELPIAHQIEIGILRCMPLMEDDGTFPDAAVITDAALGIEIDKAALLRGINCCQSSHVKSVEAWQPLGPGGGCIGGVWRMYVDPINGRRR